MTRARFFGSDTPFCGWIRACPELPSVGNNLGFSVTDNDVILHRYMTSIDKIGTREVQCLMQLEVKTRSGKPRESQMDTLTKLNLFHGTKIHIDRGITYTIRYFGYFILVMSDTTPDDSEKMWWGSIPFGIVSNNANKLKWVRINKTLLIQLLRFDINPRTFEKIILRRHHKTSHFYEQVKAPLGFMVEEHLIKRS